MRRVKGVKQAVHVYRARLLDGGIMATVQLSLTTEQAATLALILERHSEQCHTTIFEIVSGEFDGDAENKLNMYNMVSAQASVADYLQGVIDAQM